MTDYKVFVRNRTKVDPNRVKTVMMSLTSLKANEKDVLGPLLSFAQKGIVPSEEILKIIDDEDLLVNGTFIDDDLNIILSALYKRFGKTLLRDSPLL